jgi:iron(II)-dependent oxidoreductase
MQTMSPADRGSALEGQAALAVLEQTRAGTLALVAHLDATELEAVHSPIMGPLVWDLAHIAAYEDLWLCHRLFGLELLRPDLAALYDAFETPRPARQDADAGLLDTAGAYAYLATVHARSCQAVAAGDIADDTIFELVVRHELQHTETMRQAMNLAGLLPAGEPPKLTVANLKESVGGSSQTDGSACARARVRACARCHADSDTPQHAPQATVQDAQHPWVTIPAGPFVMGADPQGFAYDNERPHHRVDLPAYQIADQPLTNGAWSEFCASGGYEDRQWWTEQGWAWLHAGAAGERHDRPPTDRSDPDGCLVHITLFEAQALAKANGGRLPSEAEWEKAARAGALRGVGLVWEWTGTVFGGYEGFDAHPYREYSEVFFDRDYQVLRGSSWATHERVASVTFRNWDLPERRQIFAGVRLARDC